MRIFDEKRITALLEPMSGEGRVVVAYCAALRLFPSVLEADQERLSMVLPQLQDLRSRLKAEILSPTRSDARVQSIVRQANALIEQLPLSETATCDEDAYADDGAAALIYSCLSIGGFDVSEVISALSVSYNAVDQFAIRELSESTIDEHAVLSSAVVQSELDRQILDINQMLTDCSLATRRVLISKAEISRAIPKRAEL